MKILTREAALAWVDRLAGETTLIAPRTQDGIVRYAPVSGSAEITWEYARPKMSAKEAVFPSTDCILSIEKNGKEVTLSEPALDKPQVLFGLRPCDAHGISVLDSVYIGKEPVDTTYARRREATTLVGLACPQMFDGCFCNTMGGAPDDPSHLDVLLTAVNGGYAVQAVTDKGRALLQGLDLTEREGEPPRVAANSPEPLLGHERWPERFGDRYWDLLAERCIGCRVCTYVCPTCRCFDVRDEVVERRTEHARYDRLRCWDACTGANYRVVAGGHNPRATKGQRLRNRFFCKFYYLSESYGSDGCVGCGRCVESCPVNIDIVEVLNDVQNQARMEVTA